MSDAKSVPESGAQLAASAPDQQDALAQTRHKDPGCAEPLGSYQQAAAAKLALLESNTEDKVNRLLFKPTS